jgi:hypothetical protein
MGSHYFRKLDSVMDSGALEAQMELWWGRGRLQWRLGRSKSIPGGSIDQLSQIRITFDKEQDPESESH